MVAHSPGKQRMWIQTPALKFPVYIILNNLSKMSKKSLAFGI